MPPDSLPDSIKSLASTKARSVTCISFDKKNPQGKTESSGEPGSNIRKRKIITLDMLEKYFGSRLKDAAEELKVHKSTLKRCCRSYGIQRWPSHEGNKANPVPCDSRLSPDHNSREKQVTDANRPVAKSTLKRSCPRIGIQRWPSCKGLKANPVPRPLNELGNCVGKEQLCHSRPSLDHNSVVDKQVTDANGPGIGIYNFDYNCFLTVKARYNGCLVKFPFSTYSGIEALHKCLAKRFKLETERIRIEYENEDGDKIMISCDEDLSYHMHTLSSERTRMDLSVSLVV